jgi:hypothetical protein
MLSKSDETPKGPNHYYVFVVLNGRDGRPEYHVVNGDLVADRCSTEHQEWLKGNKRDGSQRKDTDVREFRPRADENLRDRWGDIKVEPTFHRISSIEDFIFHFDWANLARIHYH